MSLVPSTSAQPPQISFMSSAPAIHDLSNSFAGLGVQGNNPWILDSGAIDHVTSSLS